MRTHAPVSRPWMKYCSPLLVLLSPEFVVAPSALHWRLVSSPYQLSRILIPCGWATMVFAYFLIDQAMLGADRLEVVHRVVMMVKAVVHYLERNGTIRLVTGHVRKITTQNQDIGRFLRTAERVGLILLCPLVYLSAAVPLPVPMASAFLWLPALTFCRVTRWVPGLACMLLGDATKNVLVALAWWKLAH